MSDRIGGEGSRLRAGSRVVWLLALASAFLAPAVRTGYWSEDLYQSVMPRGGAVIDDSSLLGQVAGHVKATMTIGRFFPLTPALITTVHYLCHDAWTYKVYLVATGVLDVFLFYGLACKLGGRRDYGGFAACLAIGLIQYRVAVDPSLGFSGQIQLLIAGLFLCLLALLKHLESGARRWLIASGLIYFACALLYETTYLLILLPLVLIVRAPLTWARRAFVASPFFVAAGFCAFETFLVRWLFPSDAYWHKPGFDPSEVALGFAHQASAGLPLTYLAFDPLRIFPNPAGLPGWLLDAKVVAIAAAAFGLSFVCLRRQESGEGRDETAGVPWRTSMALGLILLVMPSLVTAISPYHRAKIGPGVGWIGALVEYYGVALILSAGLWNLVAATLGGGPRAAWKVVAASAVVAGLVGLTYRANVDVVRCFNAAPGSRLYRADVMHSGGTHDGERRLLEAALGSGLLADVPERSVVQLARMYPFWYDPTFSRFFYAAYAGKTIATVAPWTGPAAEGYRVREVALGRDSGYVILSRGIRGPLTPDDQPPTGGLRLYVRHPDLARSGFKITGPGAQIIAGQGLRAVRSGRDWALYALDSPEMPVAPETIGVAFDGPREPNAIAGERTRVVR